MNYYELQSEEFIRRHIGPDEAETNVMLEALGRQNIEELVQLTIPASIRLNEKLKIPPSLSEYHYLKELKKVAANNKVSKNYIGLGYYDTITPAVIQRNVFENPGWYTPYTPYQAEISQGRLEMLLNFQTMVSDLTALPVANASLLDEGTAAAEAMAMAFNIKNKSADNPVATKFFIDQHVFPQTKEVLFTRSQPLGIELVYGNYEEVELDDNYFGALIQYPNAEGNIPDYKNFILKAHEHNVLAIMACDLLSLTLLTPPGELGADVAIGSAQRFGIPLGYGGPHAAFFATKDEYVRQVPGRIIGVSVDVKGNRALRMALQTREQHIRREKATSNICTAQALLANMAAMYAIYHGPGGLKKIAERINHRAAVINEAFFELSVEQMNSNFFDTLKVRVGSNEPEVRQHAERLGINLRYYGNGYIGITLDETTTKTDISLLMQLFSSALNEKSLQKYYDSDKLKVIPQNFRRTSSFLTHPVFNTYYSETNMMRYLNYLKNKDVGLNNSMIPLGSCTMKLNSATELMPLSWPEFSSIHPFAPMRQAEGYLLIINELQNMLCEITGLAACSLQPNSGAQGEFAGLMVIRQYLWDLQMKERNIVLIPVSAHGTNPASAVMAGMKVVVVKCDDLGNIDLEDLKEKATKHKDRLAALMVTYPSTHGVFEENIKEICQVVHDYGGQIYMDGANMNAQVGLTNPAMIGADVCHLNLHKTFAIPHGGGGPGMGPICVARHLAPFLPSHQLFNDSEKDADAIHAVSSAPYGSASILLISYGYMRMLGAEGLKKASEYAILNANYMKKRLSEHYEILYTGRNGYCAHEFIIDLRPFRQTAGIEAEDVAKRLMDYGFHAPTLAFPVPGTLMIEPTESESKEELDRFCDTMIAIRQEITDIAEGITDPKDNLLKNAPHSLMEITLDEWLHPYSRQQAAYPLEYIRSNKFWPSISRINNTYGDRNLICSCEPVSSYEEA